MTIKNIIIFGKNGQVASDLLKIFSEKKNLILSISLVKILILANWKLQKNFLLNYQNQI